MRRANSTTSSAKTSTSTLSWSASASRRNSHPLLDREHRLLVLRVADDADDDAVEDPRGARDDVEVAVRDRVVAPRADGGDRADVAHCALEEASRGSSRSGGSSQRERQLGLLSFASDSTTTRPSGATTEGRWVASMGGTRKHAVGRVDQHEIVTPARRGIGREPARRVLAVHARALETELVEVADDGLGGGAIGVHEDRARRPARERLEPERPVPAKRSSTSAPSTGPMRLKTASRTRSPVGPHLEALGRDRSARPYANPR